MTLATERDRHHLWGQPVVDWFDAWRKLTRNRILVSGYRASNNVESSSEQGIAFASKALLRPCGAVAVTTMLIAGLLKIVPGLGFDPFYYLVTVVICAVRWGFGSAITCAFASLLISDFLFIPPLYTFYISDPRQIVELAIFLFVALVTGTLAARLKIEADAARRRETEMHYLYELTRRLGLCFTTGDLVAAIQKYLSDHLGCETYLVRCPPPFSDDRGEQPTPKLPDSIKRTAREMIETIDVLSRSIADESTDSRWVLKTIATKLNVYGVLAINLGASGDAARLDERIDRLLLEGTAALTRIDAATALVHADAKLQSHILKSAWIGTASHELRSPITAILGSASVINEMAATQKNATLQSLMLGMHDEAKRLDNDVQNLLDTIRIADSGVQPRFVYSDPADIIAAALRERTDHVTTHQLKISIDRELPLVNIDPVLMEQALGHLIENAAKYSVAGSDIAIAARNVDNHILISVTDQGVGLTEEETRRLFQRGVRGARHVGNVPGLGLGLWIAHVFVTANGGGLQAFSPGLEQGTTMTIALPVHSALGPPASAVNAQTC